MPSRSEPVAAAYQRAAVHTAIGDPAKLDFCAAVSAVHFDVLGLTASVDAVQAPGGCDLELRTRAGHTMALYVFTDIDGMTDPNGTTVGTRTSHVSGLPVLTFNNRYGSGWCERIVGQGALDLDVELQGNAGERPPRSTACAITGAVADHLAHVTATDSYRHLQLPTPTLSDLDFCAVADTTVSLLPIHDLRPQLGPSTTIGCRLTAPLTGGRGANVTISLLLDRRGSIPHAVNRSIAGHPVLVIDDPAHHGDPCTYVSRQARSPGGYYEEITVNTFGTNTALPLATTCSTNQAEIQAFLTTAGLH